MLCDKNGNQVAALEVDHTIRFERSAPASCKFTLGYDQTGAAELLELVQTQTPQLLAYRNKVLIFRGWWAPQDETADGTTSDGIACEFRSPMAQLEDRYRSFSLTRTSTDAGVIAWGLIDDTNTLGDTGIDRGKIPTTINRTRTYDVGQQLSAAISDMTAENIDGGFDYLETYLEPGNGSKLSLFNVYAPLGFDRSKSIIFQYGPETLGNVLSMERAISHPINRVIATGGTATIAVAIDDTISQGAYGTYMTFQAFQGINEQSHLNQQAAGMLQVLPIVEVSFSPDINMAPRPIDDYFVGDTVGFYARQDDLEVAVDVQITAIELERDADGFETGHNLEFGSQAEELLVPVRHTRRVLLKKIGRQGKGAHHHPKPGKKGGKKTPPHRKRK